MSEELDKKTVHPEVIALPPLKMTLFYIVDERLKKEALLAENSASLAKQEEQAKPQALKKIIEHLEKKP